MRDDTDRLYYRIKYLPDAIRRTEDKLAALYAEAEAYSMKDLKRRASFDRAWDREVQIAQMEARESGREFSTDQDRWAANHAD